MVVGSEIQCFYVFFLLKMRKGKLKRRLTGLKKGNKWYKKRAQYVPTVQIKKSVVRVDSSCVEEKQWELLQI